MIERKIVPNPQTLRKMLNPWDPAALPFRDVIESAYVGAELAKKGGGDEFAIRLADELEIILYSTVHRWRNGTATPHPILQALVVKAVAAIMRDVHVDFDAQPDDDEDTTPPASTLHPK